MKNKDFPSKSYNAVFIDFPESWLNFMFVVYSFKIPFSVTTLKAQFSTTKNAN